MAERQPGTLACMRCGSPLPRARFNTPGRTSCPGCGVTTYAAVFPALYAERGAADAGAPVTSDEEAGCFFHPGKRAVVTCDSCGRFLCALCDVVMSERHICPRCIEVGVKKSKLENLTNARTLYDAIALAMAVVPIFLMWPLTFITAPVAIYMVFHYWKRPRSIVHPGRWRLIVALLFACVQVTVWTIVAVKLLNA